ncbi:MAG: DUF2064 domain-containing protein [Bdellovibrionales bacterium]
MKQPKVAIAVFVKTPGLSPIKTRLANSIGKSLAEQFYLISCSCIQSTLAQLSESKPNVTPYWAIAEKEGLEVNVWKEFRNISQNEGSLGERLSHIYDSLFESYNNVLVVGADSPQLTSNLFLEALEGLRTFDFVLGPADDGGFYLFGGKKSVPREVWTNVRYSLSDTRSQLASQLVDFGSVKFLPTQIDVDSIKDLESLQESLSLLSNPNQKQIALLHWIKAQRRGTEP